MNDHKMFTVILVIAVIILTWFAHYDLNRIDDLEQRVTTFETVRIEYIAPPEGVSP
jgi:hypothetical protein